MKYNTGEINHLIRNRRSVKPANYSGIAVDESVIREMLENARWAPTHGKTEPWRFFVFHHDGLQKLANFQSELYKNITPPEQFIETKFEKLQNTPLKSSYVIMIGLSRQQSGKIPLVEEVLAVGCAVQNMQLTAAAFGVASYWSTGGMTYKDEMKTFLGLGNDDLCLGMLYIGNYQGEPLISLRSPIEEKTVWIGS
ncbi:MAG: nitroreductase [Chitinophagales bacterium]